MPDTEERVALRDTVGIAPFVVSRLRLEDGSETDFKFSGLMDKVNRRSSKTTLLTTFDATHSGSLVNQRVYPGVRMRDSVKYWTYPFNKPVQERHTSRNAKAGDPEPKVYGRIRAAEYIQFVDEQTLIKDWVAPKSRDQGSGFCKVQAAIHDPQAIEELLDEPKETRRFHTVSAGFDTNHMHCSICGSDWAKKGGRCDHLPGQAYKLNDAEEESMMFFITGLLFYDELARVNNPAQPYATVLENEFFDSKMISDLFSNGEVHNGHWSRLVLIDSRDGVMDLLLGDAQDKEDPTSRWTTDEWAEACILSALADSARLKAAALEDALPRIEAFRTSDRKPDFGQPRTRIGPGGAIPIYDANTANAALRLVDSVEGADTKSLRSRILECASSLARIGDSAMKDPAQEWADVVKVADGLKAEECRDWSDFDGDLYELAMEEGEAEVVGVAANIIDKKLTTESRKALPDSAFCGPNRSFPVHDTAHVRNALARLPQATRFSSTQKAKILTCVRNRAKKLGVVVSTDQVEYNHLIGLLDKKRTPDPILDQDVPDGETDAKKAKRLDGQLSAARAKIDDQNGQITRLLDELTDIRGDLHRRLAARVFELRNQLDKPDIKALDSEEKKQEFVTKLTLRGTASLKDAVADLEAEIPSDEGKGPQNQNQEGDPTDPKDDKGKKGETTKSSDASQRAALEAEMDG